MLGESSEELSEGYVGVIRIVHPRTANVQDVFVSRENRSDYEDYDIGDLYPNGWYVFERGFYDEEMSESEILARLRDDDRKEREGHIPIVSLREDVGSGCIGRDRHGYTII